MRIAIIANTSWYLANFRVNLIKELCAAGHEVVAMAPYDAKWSGKIIEAGATFRSLYLSRNRYSALLEPLFLVCNIKVIWEARINILFSYTPKGNIYTGIVAALISRPWVPNISGVGSIYNYWEIAQSMLDILYRFTIPYAKFVFFQNNDDLNRFVERRIVNRERCIRLPGSGVDLVRFDFRKKQPNTSNEVRFLLFGRLLWDKGVGVFVDAAKIIKIKYPFVRFQILGFIEKNSDRGVSLSQLNQWVSDELIEYLGSTDDVRCYIESADCIVSPSYYGEGVPRALLEAAAMGRPIITTDSPGCRDVVVDSVTGFSCKPRSVADLADKMEMFVLLPVIQKERMGFNARRRIEERYDEKVVLSAYLNVVNEIGVCR